MMKRHIHRGYIEGYYGRLLSFEERHQLLTRRAPVSPKIDHHGAIERFVNQILLRIVLVNVDYVHNILGYDSPSTSDIV